MHTYSECKVKIAGIKFMLDNLIQLESRIETKHRLESIIQMCDELINEEIDGKETRSRQS